MFSAFVFLLAVSAFTFACPLTVFDVKTQKLKVEQLVVKQTTGYNEVWADVSYKVEKPPDDLLFTPLYCWFGPPDQRCADVDMTNEYHPSNGFTFANFIASAK